MQVDRLEEGSNVIQEQHQYDVNSLKQEYQKKIRILQTELDQKLSTVRNLCIFLLCLLFLLMCLMLYLTKSGVQENLEEKVDSLNTNITSYLTKLEDRVQKQLKEEVSVIQSQHEKKVDKVKKNIEEKVDSLNTNITSYLTKLEDRAQKQLKEEVSVIQSQHEKKVDKVKKNLEEKVDSLNTNIMSYLTKLEDRVQKKLKEEVSVIQSQHEKKVNMVKKSLEDKVDSFNTHLRVTEESRIFTWKITSFAIKLKQAKNKVKEHVESDPFYMYGYKLKLQMYPNGYVNVKNTHLSIFIFVMKGENDAMLPWPFKKKVKFTLIDQQEDSVKRKNVFLSFIPGYRPESFARPTQEENAVSGYTEFISHEKLYSRRYLVDDTLFLQVETGP